MSAVNASAVRDERAPMRQTAAAEFRELARCASLEVGIHDVRSLDDARSWLAPNTRVFVSHLPKQSWEATINAAQKVRRAGFDPVPHIPVRLLRDRAAAEELIVQLRDEAQINEALIISGDYAQPQGSFESVIDFMQTNLLERHGLKRVCFAGHPEGHPGVALDVVRQAEIDKLRYARDAGLESTLVTQFFFDAQPFLQWAETIRSHTIPVRIAAGIAGPASVGALFKFAMRCGVGRSINALSGRTSAFGKLLGEHGPDELVRDLADARLSGASNFDEIHLFSFGGFRRTYEWLGAAAGAHAPT